MKLSSFAIVLAASAGNHAVNAFTSVSGTNQRLARAASATPAPFGVVIPTEGSATALAGRRRKGKKTYGKVNIKKPSTSSPVIKAVTESEIRSLFSLWNNALATGDSRIVAKRYAKEAVLLPTVSDTPRTDYASIKDYFDAFLLKEPQGTILEGDIRIGDGWAQDAGIYEFTMGATGDKVKARYTYVYVFENNQWKIAHHHSSVMPEGIDIAKAITEDEVRGLFQLWNSALDTLDSDAVAKRYAKTGVLLPTVSDVPRTDYDSIKDYFNAFLLKKPQGTILESNVMIGTNWCQDAGIYEFTMGATGDKVKARYSFIYTFEDGQWKIAHHHSSMMPEAQLEPVTTSADPSAVVLEDKDVKSLFSLWNDALATLDPDAVAARYSKSPCLLPTVSDVPRTDYDSIKAYFVDFLKKEPQGTILESYTTSGPNWCMDDGIYEFVFGATGDIVKARYSFVYTKDENDDTWKIAHHHSSQMPEEVVPKASLEAAVVEA
uniref:Calcium/calmodulin-dependent protein kinase II association-domain domain-containing protein n=1 Tax=Odontella aurita TaxID=265563 RepID=A0A7S4J4T4_9STRA|mmetsp:Transcript_38513/g.115549  ORF Transcript_38513/g.115549 Transcript_38513/m.115549 type:complete len:491 (+) Transcript_38513:195-1667(+)